MDYAADLITALGIGAAAGLAPLTAIAATVLLVAAHFGVNPAGNSLATLTGVVFVVIAVIVIVQTLLADLSLGGVRFRIAADRPGSLAVNVGFAAVFGGLAGAIVFNAANHGWAVGAIVAAASAALVATAFKRFFAGVHDRMRRKAKDGEPPDSRALALLVDLVTIATVVVSLVLPEVGLILPALAILLLLRTRDRAEQKYAGLRSLR